MGAYHEDHWAVEVNGTTVRWNDVVAMRPVFDDPDRGCDCPPGGHTLTGTCLPVGNGGARLSQVGGEHYRQFKIQPWDIWQEYGLNAFEGAILKYLLRRKGSRVEDLKKARHTLDRLIEIEEGKEGE